MVSGTTRLPSTPNAASRTVAPPPPPPPPASKLHQLLSVAWLAILLGMAMEALMLAVAAGFHAAAAPDPFLAELAQKVSWSFVVCVGLGIGAAINRARPAAMGLLGLVCAPLAFNLSRALHKGLAGALGVAVAAGPAPFAVAALKATEYALLGFALGHLGLRGAGALAHIGAGLAAGLLFGVPILAMSAGALEVTPPVIARSLNELAFPVGCSLVIYAAEILGQRRR
jgi:hypothetical protein